MRVLVILYVGSNLDFQISSGRLSIFDLVDATTFQGFYPGTQNSYIIGILHAVSFCICVTFTIILKVICKT